MDTARASRLYKYKARSAEEMDRTTVSKEASVMKVILVGMEACFKFGKNTKFMNTRREALRKWP